jgi:transposase-like protein
MEADMPRKLYDQQYETQAIKLAQTQGINPNMLGRWKREHETNTSQGRPAFTGRGVPALSEQEQEIQRLRKELEIARQERDILKKAVTCLDHTAAPSGLVASSPRKASEIQIHSRAPRRIQPRDPAAST